MTTLSKEETRLLFLYEFNSDNKNAADVSRKINHAFGDGTTSERAVQDWFKKFRAGDFDLKDKPRSGRSKVLDEVEFEAVMEDHPNQSLQELASHFGISKQTASVYKKRLGIIDNSKKVKKTSKEAKAKKVNKVKKEKKEKKEE